MKSSNILIITGGTGGHIFPAMAIGNYLELRGLNVYYLISGSKINLEGKENMFFTRSIPFEKSIPKFIEASILFIINFFKGIKFLSKIKPCVIIATGSYAVAPILLSSILLRKPFYLMEQNVLPGIVNRIFSAFSKATFIAFEESKKYLKGKVIHVGLPIRENSRLKIPKGEARKVLNLPHDKKIVLVIGGSLGAKGLVEKILPVAISKEYIYFIIQTGTRNFDYFNSLLSSLSPANIKLIPFIDNMGLYYSAVDLVISRAGASSCMEIVYHDKPAILVPYPYSRDKHQYFNAKVLTEGGKSIMLEETEVRAKIESLLDIENLFKGKYKDNIFIPDSEEITYREIMSHANC
ncbi:MAG: UDP-N-acetylglucosamine--N-acetylmuramyl-(pentapeptide) pyrophosphoryl-undecaprenol N-acetylglucosamine transferase [candidate division WOR-3 bacterium]